MKSMGKNSSEDKIFLAKERQLLAVSVPKVGEIESPLSSPPFV
jgi:hypothetical protein